MGFIEKGRENTLSIRFQENCGSLQNSETKRTELVTLNWQQSSGAVSSSEVIALPVPYELPPQPYSSEGETQLSNCISLSCMFPSSYSPDYLFSTDVPWAWDRRYNKKDVYGQVWPRQVQLYASQDS